MPDFNRFETAGELINAAAVEVGLSPVTDPYASSDANFVQFCALLKTSGRQLLSSRHRWSYLVKTHTFPISYGDSGLYAVPNDFEYLISDSAWDTTEPDSLTGPLSPQNWQWLINDGLTPTTPFFRFRGTHVEIFPILTGGVGQYATYSYEYLSRGWVKDANNPSVTRDYPSQSADIVCYSAPLIIAMLKYKFLAAKGFDTTAASAEFSIAYDQAVSKDVPGVTLSLVPGTSHRLLDPGEFTGIGL